MKYNPSIISIEDLVSFGFNRKLIRHNIMRLLSSTGINWMQRIAMLVLIWLNNIFDRSGALIQNVLEFTLESGLALNLGSAMFHDHMITHYSIAKCTERLGNMPPPNGEPPLNNIPSRLWKTMHTAPRSQTLLCRELRTRSRWVNSSSTLSFALSGEKSINFLASEPRLRLLPIWIFFEECYTVTIHQNGQYVIGICKWKTLHTVYKVV